MLPSQSDDESPHFNSTRGKAGICPLVLTEATLSFKRSNQFLREVCDKPLPLPLRKGR